MARVGLSTTHAFCIFIVNIDHIYSSFRPIPTLNMVYMQGVKLGNIIIDCMQSLC